MACLNSVIQEIPETMLIYVVSHERPDGDALGSQIAFTNYLHQKGKQAFVVLCEPVSDIFKPFFRSTPTVTLKDLNRGEEGFWVALDCNHPQRIHPALIEKTFSLVIDHHPKNGNWGEICFLDTNASSTCEILVKLLKESGYAFDNPCINDALYVGLLTDSGNFTHSDISKFTFECAELLVNSGVQPYKIVQQLFHNKSKAQLKLQSIFLSRVELYAKGKIAVSTLSEEDYKATHTCHGDTEGFVNSLLTLKNAQIAAFIEYNEMGTKVSLRSSDPSILVNKVAQKFGGGGHPCAAGFKLEKQQFSFEGLFYELESLFK